MSSSPQEHFHATVFRLTVGFIPAESFVPLPILPFWHPWWLLVASVAWVIVTTWLARRGLGVSGLIPLVRRWLQGSRLPARVSKPFHHY